MGCAEDGRVGDAAPTPEGPGTEGCGSTRCSGDCAPAHHERDWALGACCAADLSPVSAEGRPNPSAGSGQALPFPQERVMTRTLGRFTMSGG